MLQSTVLFLLSGVCMGHVVQPIPSHHHETVVYSMRHDVSSPLKNCSFPPSDVLSMVINGQEEEPFLFLQKCNVKPVPDDDESLLCMTLYDIGLKMCTGSYDELPILEKITRSLPSTASEFRNLIVQDLATNKPKADDLCNQMKFVLEEPSFPQTKKWNLKNTFTENVSACNKLCYDYKNNERELCKLILWGSQLLKNVKSGQQEVLITKKTADSAVVNIGSNTFHPSYPDEVTQKKEVSDKSDVQAEVPVVKPQSGTEPDLNVKSPLNEANDQNKESIIQSPISKQPSSSGSQSEITGKAASQPNTYDAIGLEKSSQQDTQKKGSSTLSGQTQESLSTKENTRKSTSNEGKIDLPPQVAVSSSSSTVKGVAEEEAEIPDNTQPLPGDGNLDIDGQDIAPSEDDDTNYNGVGVESPDKPELTESKSEFKLPQDTEDFDNKFISEKFGDAEDSHFFSYFTTLVLFCIIGYLVFHNKQKILALVLEGRSRRSNRRRPNTANYHKLDCNLEEAVSSPCSTSATHVIY